MVRLRPQILRLGESDPPPPASGRARRAQRRPRAPPELANQRSAQTFPNSPHQLSASPLPERPAWPSAGAQGEARAGSPAVFCRSRVELAASACA